MAQPRARRVPLQPSPQRDAPLRPRATLGSARPASLARCPRQPNPAPRDGAGVGCPGPAALAGCPRDVPSERWGERGRPRPRRSRLSFWWWLSGQRCHRVLLPLHGSNRNGPGGVGGSPPPTPLGLGRPPAPRVPAPAGTPEQGRAPAGRGGANTRRGRGGGQGPGARAEPPSPLSTGPGGSGVLCSPGVGGCFAPGPPSLVAGNPTPCVPVPGGCQDSPSQLPGPSRTPARTPRPVPRCPLTPAPGAGVGLCSLPTSRPTSEGQKRNRGVPVPDGGLAQVPPTRGCPG